MSGEPLDAQEAQPAPPAEESDSGEAQAAPPSPPWLFVLQAPLWFRRAVWRWAAFARPLYLDATGGPRQAWIAAAIAAGLLPLLLIALPFGSPLHGPVTGALLTLLFLASLRAERPGAAATTLVLVYVSHCALAIALSAEHPEVMARALPLGADYWESQRAWITLGQNQEYLVATWFPTHVQIFLAVVVLGYLTFGLLPFFLGFLQVDLMNYYVGQLVANSESVPTALALGWHPWSVARGVSYTFASVAAGLVSLGRIRGEPLISRARLRALWALALVFFFLDCVLKYSVSEAVRGVLASNLGAP